MKHWWVVPAFLVAASGSALADGPAWCKAVGQHKVDFNITNGNGEFKYASEADDKDNDAISDLVGALCTPGPENYTKGADAKKYHTQIEAARARWSKRLAMTDEDWADAADWAASGIGERRGLSLSSGAMELDKKPWSGFGPVQQYIALTRGSGRSGSAMLDHRYTADAFGSNISQAGRLGYITHCIDSNSKAVDWAMCQADIAAFDMAKLSAELRADKAGTGFQKMTIRLVADEYARKRLPEHAAEVKKLVASDPGYGKLFDLADKTTKEWDARYKADGQLLDLVATMDDAAATNSRKAFEGCDDKTWKAWQAAVATIPAKTFAGMHDKVEDADLMYPQAMAAVLSNPEAYLAGLSYALCHKGEQKDFFNKVLGDGLMRWPGHRGPRNSVQLAAMKAGIELDDRDAKLEFPSVNRQWFENGSGTHGGGGFGAVSKVTSDGKKVHLEFSPVPVKQDQCTKEVVTHRIERIREDGAIVYERQCLASKTVTVNRASRPTDVDARFGTALKSGMVVSVLEGALLAAWPSNGAKQPSIIFGVPVK